MIGEPSGRPGRAGPSEGGHGSRAGRAPPPDLGRHRHAPDFV